MNPHEYAAAHAPRFLDQLKELLRIPSVSTLPERAGDVRRAAEWVAADLRRIGMQTVEIIPTPGHPVVYGEWLGAGLSAPTMLIYGHYDVQPAALEDGWTSDPFEPVERDGRLVARGASDDKGQVFAQMKAAEALLATGGAPVNLKFLIEGEEEIGTPHLGAVLAAQRERLRADMCVISDTGMHTPEQPTIVYGLRGMAYMEIEVWGPKHDLHSGGYGGIVYNPAQALAEIVAALHDAEGRVAVPGFYDDVLPLSEAERAELARSAPTEAQWAQETGVTRFWGEPGYALHERVGARPTLEVNGLSGGFAGAGAKTVLPARALAKISCRLVANQTPSRVYQQVREYVARLTPAAVRSEVRLIAQAYPALTRLDSPAMEAACAAYERGWERRPVFERGGGTLPVVADLQRELGLPVVLMGFGLRSDGAHGPDEGYRIDMFYRGIRTAICLSQIVGQMGRAGLSG